MKGFGRDIDIRNSLPYYRIYRDGKASEKLSDISELWNNDLVTICIGCSFSFEEALIENRIPVRHIDEGKNVPMYTTNIETKPFGIFSGKTVVSMRPVKNEMINFAVETSKPFTKSHGSPIHTGNPEEIGISDINAPDFGDKVSINPGEAPLFWACGVTALTVMEESKPSFAIVHEPGYMLVTTALHDEISDPLRN